MKERLQEAASERITEMERDHVDLAIVIPALHEAENLDLLLPQLRDILATLDASYEILIVDRTPDEQTQTLAETYGARLLDQQQRGYGAALVMAFREVQAHFILTMDADLSHPPLYIHDMWRRRQEADVIIASRYTAGGQYEMPLLRSLLSRILNLFFSRGLDLKVRDMSSGFRLYKARAVQSLNLRQRDFDVLQEILVKAHAGGWTIKEVPFNYVPREHGSSHARVLAFGLSYLRTFRSLYRLRNSILSADYDARAHDSIVLPQRYWQRQRYRHITTLLRGEGPTLDVGSGSSRIIAALPSGSVAVDILLPKLRYSRRYGAMLAHASGFQLPFAAESFPCVLCSQVIEHVPKESPILDELDRVLAPGGALVLGTPDYANWEWRFTEAVYQRVLPSAYADEHISHYTRAELIRLFTQRGYQLEATRYILRGELILKFRKPSRSLSRG
ncbi:MAG: glycosyltransferase [Anaerolineae bacterium]|nr:glycosyltransferase [Anaerolineae bacterium]